MPCALTELHYRFCGLFPITRQKLPPDFRPVRIKQETKDTKAWDAQRAELERQNEEWDKAVAWRDGREAAMKSADDATFSARLAEQRKKHTAKAAASTAQCAAARERLVEFTKERERLERLVDQVLTPAKQRALSLYRSQGHDHGIS